MTQTISRIYDNAEKAEAAVKELKRVGFADHAVSVVAPMHSAEAALPAITGSGVIASHATVYADALARGETLVSVRAPFGFAATATTILEKHRPTETGLGEQGYEQPPPDPAAPLSSALGWSVLSDNPTPLSSALGLSTLSKNQRKQVRDDELIDNPAPLSRAFGLKLLSDRAAPLSSKFGWKLLSDNPAPLSSKLGMSPLSKDQNAPDSRFGMKLLSDNPAPLSSALGWKLLSDNPAPLSSWFNWRVLSRDQK